MIIIVIFCLLAIIFLIIWMVLSFRSDVLDEDNWKTYIVNCECIALHSDTISKCGYTSIFKLEDLVKPCLRNDNYDVNIDTLNRNIIIKDKETYGENFYVFLNSEKILYQDKMILLHLVSYNIYLMWLQSLFENAETGGVSLEKVIEDEISIEKNILN